MRELIELEQEPTDSLSSCARWFDLSSKYSLLKKGVKELREGEKRKKEECDALDRFFTESRAKLGNFGRLIKAENKQLELVGALVNEFLDLNYAADVNQQLAQEFNSLKVDDQVRFKIERLENFIEFMAAALRLNQTKSPTRSSSEFAQVKQQQQRPNEPQDELFELDSALKQLLDREEFLDEAELRDLRELGDMLEEILNAGYVNLASAKFRYLSGTLDAVRAVLLHRLQPRTTNQLEQAPDTGSDSYSDSDSDLDTD